MIDPGGWVGLLCAAGVGVALGWYLHKKLQNASLELHSQSADINWLRAALADSEQRSAKQAVWLADLEAEVVDLRLKEVTASPKKKAPTQGTPETA